MKISKNELKKIIIEMINEKEDQDGDGDKDFADIMIARRKASGEDEEEAIEKTKEKSYNESLNVSYDQLRKIIREEYCRHLGIKLKRKSRWYFE